MSKNKGIGFRTLKALTLSVALTIGLSSGAADWQNLDQHNRLCGRMVSPGYLLGKVVLVYVGDFRNDAAAFDQLKRLEATWQCYKSRPFVLLGSHREVEPGHHDGTAEKLARAGVTFPVYDGARLPESAEPKSTAAAYFYLVDAAGKSRFVNRDEHRAMESLVNWLANADSPATEKVLRQMVEFENARLPGRAWLRLKELKASDPMQAEPFDDQWLALDGDEDVKKVAKLEEFARQAKEYDPSAKGKRRVSVEKIDRIIAYFEPMKSCGRAEIEQEVKNCLADLIWAKADFAAAQKGAGAGKDGK